MSSHNEIVLHHVVRDVRVVARWVIDDGCFGRASVLTCTFVPSPVPRLALMFGVLRGLGVQRRIEPLLLSRLSLDPEVTQRILTYIDRTNAGTLGALGAVALIATVLSVLGSIEASFNEIWRVRAAQTVLTLCHVTPAPPYINPPRLRTWRCFPAPPSSTTSTSSADPGGTNHACRLAFFCAAKMPSHSVEHVRLHVRASTVHETIVPNCARPENSLVCAGAMRALGCGGGAFQTLGWCSRAAIRRDGTESQMRTLRLHPAIEGFC